MHDGGVVVRGDRIMYAACIFPLTRRIDINNTLGTRHRAAIGLSEETDAIVVLVSEETGDIAYCHNGALHRQVSLKQLKDFLNDQLKSDAPTKNRPAHRCSACAIPCGPCWISSKRNSGRIPVNPWQTTHNPRA